MKRTLSQLLNDPKAAKVVVSQLDKDGQAHKWTRVPRKGFTLSAFAVGRTYRFRILTAEDQYLGSRQVIIPPKKK